MENILLTLPGTTLTTLVKYIFVDSHRVLVKEFSKGNTVTLGLHIFNLSCCMDGLIF